MAKGEEQFGDYQLRQRVAVGGMAEIFLAQRRGPGGFAKMVAVKRVLPELARQDEFRVMFADEARLCASLTHPGLVQVFDYGEVDGVPFLVMEWVDGVDLATLIRPERPFQPEAAALVTAEICRALAYVHEARDSKGAPLHIVHRDLSPGNVLMSRGGDVKLGDFGVAQARGRLAKTEAGKLKGTLAYLSPEQVSGDPVDRRADIYAAGLLLFELLTGERYVQGDSEVQLLQAAMNPPSRSAADLRPELNPAFDEILRRALARDPEARFRDAAELEGELRRLCPDATRARDLVISQVERALEGSTTRRRTNVMSVEPLPLGDRLRRTLRRADSRWIWLSAALAAVVAVAVAGLWIAWSRDDEPQIEVSAISPDRAGPATPADASAESPEPEPSTPMDATPEATDSSVPPEAPEASEPPAPPPATIERTSGDAGSREPRPRAPRIAPPTEPEPEPEPVPEPDDATPEVAEGPTPADLLSEADRLRRGRGIRPGDDGELDQLRNRAATLALRGGPPDEARRAVEAYRRRTGEVAIDQGFVERKMRRATRAIEAAQPSGELANRLDALSQQAIRSALSRDYQGANRQLNRIFDLLR